MELSEVPAKLPDERAKEWKDRIFEQTSLLDPTVSAVAEEIAESVEASSGTVRKPLTNFLNGYAKEVFRWLADDPTPYGEALCDALNGAVTPEELLQVYLSLMPSLGGRELGPETLQHLELQVGLPEDSNRLNPLETWFRKRGRHHDFDWQLECDGECQSWDEFSDHLEEMYEHLSTLDAPPSVTFRASRADRRQMLRAHDEDGLVLELAQDRLRDFAREKRLIVETGEDDAVELVIPFRRIDSKAINAWLEKLEDLALLSNRQASRARNFFETIPVERLNELSKSHLLYALEDASNDRLDYSPSVFQRRHVEWIRRDLREEAEPTAERWLRNTKDPFRRWIDITGALRGMATQEQLDQILGVAAARNDDVPREELVRGIEATLATDNPEDLESLKSKLLKLRPDKLTQSLDDSNLIKRLKLKGNRYELTPALRSLAEWEVPLHLKPRDLTEIDVDANDTLVSEAIRLAPAERLDDWCRAALNVEGLGQPQTIWTVLRALTRRGGPSEDLPREPLVGLWASHLWATIFRLHSYLEGGPNRHPQTIARRASEELRDALPLLDHPDGPLAALEPLVDERIKESVERWLKGAEPDFEEPPEEQLTKLAPFQIPMSDARRLNPDQEWSWRPLSLKDRRTLHLAERGDREARRMVLADGANFYVHEELSPKKRLAWWRDIVPGAELKDSEREWFQRDLEKALEKYSNDEGSKQDDDWLRHELAATLQHEQLGDHLPYQIDEPLEAIQSGPPAALDWFLKRFPGESNRLDHLLALADILDAKEFLQDLIADDLSELSDETRAWLYKSRLSANENPRQQPELSFPNLKELAEFRHRAILLLARLGDPGPLRDSLDRPWEAQAPEIAHQGALAQALLRAVAPHRVHRDQPVIDDDVWRKLVEQLAGRPLEQLRSRALEIEGWSLPADSERGLHPSRNRLLIIEDAPPQERWSQLAPFTATLWRHRSSEDLQDFWRLLKSEVVERESDATWRAPHNLHLERKEWALRNDDETLETWCKESFDVSKLADDLDGLAESAWPHLTSDQQKVLLERLPKGDLADHWWSRGQELPLDARLDFARKHGTRRERRRIARNLLQAQPADDPEKKVAAWFRLRPDNRPPLDELEETIRQFEASLDPNDLTAGEAWRWAGVLAETRDTEEAVNWLPAILKRAFRTELEEADPGETPFEEMPAGIDTLLYQFEDTFSEMKSSERADLDDRLRRLETQIQNESARKLPDADRDMRRNISDRIKEIREEIESIDRHSDAGGRKSYANAAKELENLAANPEDNYRLAVEGLFHRLSEDDSTRLIRDALATPELLAIDGALGSLIRQIDQSTMSQPDALEATETLLNNSATRLRALSEDKETAHQRRAVIVDLLEVAPVIRQPALREKVYRHAREHYDEL